VWLGGPGPGCFVEMEFSDFLPRLASKFFLISTSQVARITGVSHYTWLLVFLNTNGYTLHIVLPLAFGCNIQCFLILFRVILINDHILLTWDSTVVSVSHAQDFRWFPVTVLFCASVVVFTCGSIAYLLE
jgi:hypothetical protein